MARTRRRALTAEKVRMARELWREGWTANELAKRFDAAPSTVLSAVRGNTWKHIPGAVTEDRRAVLTEELVREARRIRRQGWRVFELAKEYGVANGTMGKALRGHSWPHVEDPVTESDDYRGEGCPNARLTDRRVMEARKLYRAGWTFGELGERYDVTHVTVMYAVHGKTWGHLPGAVPPTGHLKGEDAAHAKLTAPRVRSIRRRYAAGESPKLLAEEYGVSGGAIFAAVQRRTWKHVK